MKNVKVRGRKLELAQYLKEVKRLVSMSQCILFIPYKTMFDFARANVN